MRNPSSLHRAHVPTFILLLLICAVLRSLGYFSHTTVISRHCTYRQSYTLILSPSIQSINTTSSTRATIGTTVNVKDLFLNYPVRQFSSRSNRHFEWIELQKMTVGIGLASPVALSLRTCTGNKIVRIDPYEEKDRATYVLEKGLNCTLSSWSTFEGQHESTIVSVKVCFANTPRNYLFICKLH
jgi:DNA mismatch repair ATPase MutL